MEDRVILIDKPAGVSSFGVVARVRGKLKEEFGHKVKVGHTGTLDPFATGLLILLSGKMTKKSSEFLKLDKVYEATLRLGFTSSTGDTEGEIRPYLRGRDGRDEIQGHFATGHLQLMEGSGATELRGDECEEVRPKQSMIESTIASFVGKIRQTPPRFSAIKVNGERAYKLARRGEDFEMPSREVEIYSIEILEYRYPELVVLCHVSSGTYIRTLAEDIGERLGVGAYLTALRRIRVGEYDVAAATRLDEFLGV